MGIGDNAARDGFVPEYFQSLEALESDYFWFTARNNLVLWVASRYFPFAGVILDLGCGTGLMLTGMERVYPRAFLYGADLYPEALVLASRRLERAILLQTDIRSLPFEHEFDLIGIFDVLEHIEDDEAVLGGINRALVPGGGLLMTVPQHPKLWSRQDEHSRHVRRYMASELRAKLIKCGFKVVFETSFVSILFPFMALSRLLRSRMSRLHFFKGIKDDPMAELKMPRGLNSFFREVMSIELSIIKSGVSLPFGGSLLLAAVKNRDLVGPDGGQARRVPAKRDALKGHNKRWKSSLCDLW